MIRLEAVKGRLRPKSPHEATVSLFVRMPMRCVLALIVEMFPDQTPTKATSTFMEKASLNPLARFSFPLEVSLYFAYANEMCSSLDLGKSPT